MHTAHKFARITDRVKVCLPRYWSRPHLGIRVFSQETSATTRQLPWSETVICESSMPTFETVQEKAAYSRYLTVFDRVVRVTCEETGKIQDVHYDVVGHPKCNFKSVTVLPFHPAKDGQGPQFTLIREYMQGPGTVTYNVPSGGFDPSKHQTLKDCALAELSEEAMLHGGQLVRLTPEDHPGFVEVKWCANRFHPFLVIDPETDPDPGQRDAEEHIQVVRVGVSEVEQLVASGEFPLPSMVTIRMAVDYLKQQGRLTQ